MLAKVKRNAIELRRNSGAVVGTLRREVRSECWSDRASQRERCHCCFLKFAANMVGVAVKGTCAVAGNFF